MQKKLIALAVAGLASSGVMAQSNVTVYGNVDLAVVGASGTSSGTNSLGFSGTGVTAANVALGSTTQMISGIRSASKVGFKGAESLGGGLKASFVVETGIDASGNLGQTAPAAANGGLVGNRVSTLALEGAFGAVSAGRMAVGADFAAFDAAGDLAPGSISYLMYDQSSSRANNTIQYVTPDIAGFTGTYQVSMSENQDKVAVTVTGTQTALELAYSNGPLLVKLGQTVARDITPAVLSTKFTLNNLGAAYDFGVAKLSGQYVTQRNSSVAGAAATIDANTWQLGVKVPMGAHAFSANYVSTDDKRAANADAHSWYLGYDYAMSKRTTAYLGAVKVTNKNGASFSALAANTATSVNNNGRTDAVFAGMNHSF